MPAEKVPGPLFYCYGILIAGGAGDSDVNPNQQDDNVNHVVIRLAKASEYSKRMTRGTHSQMEGRKTTFRAYANAARIRMIDNPSRQASIG